MNTNNLMSKKSKSNLANCFYWLQAISDKKKVYSKKENKSVTFKLSFITLTLPAIQKHSDQYIKSHCLEPFLKWMQRNYQCNSIIWKAETQNNGNIHFHITTNKFIHWKSIRTKWNRIMFKHGYCKVYQDGSNDSGDAATQIKAVIKDKQIQQYMVGYIAKKDQFKKMYCSRSKKKIFFTTEVDTDNGHYYHSSNYRQIHCEDGTAREYKRSIEGRVWGASQHLNQPPLVMCEGHQEFEKLNNLMNFSDDVRVKAEDFFAIHLYKTKIFNQMPHAIQDEFNFRINDLKEFDIPQKNLTIETFH